eukprot:278829-Pelagomonas_calceolata.AAC.1
MQTRARTHTQPARASKPAPQRQPSAATKLLKGGPAPQPAQQQQQQQQQGNSGSADDTDYMSEEVEEASNGKGSKRPRVGGRKDGMSSLCKSLCRIMACAALLSFDKCH